MSILTVILPDGGQFAGESRPGRAGLEGRIKALTLLAGLDPESRVEEHHNHRDFLDLDLRHGETWQSLLLAISIKSGMMLRRWLDPEYARLQPVFDAAFYLRKYPDVAAAGVDPLRHYLKDGAKEGRQPLPLFLPAHYLRNCSAARQAGGNPLLHFLSWHGAACPNPHPLFDCAAYVQAHPEAAAMNPLVHYLRTPAGENPAREGSQFGQCEP